MLGTSNRTRSGSKATLLAALVAAGLAAAPGARAQTTVNATTDTVGFQFGAVGVGGVIQANGLGTGGISATTPAVNDETYATFVLPTLQAGQVFSAADFSLFKSSAFNFDPNNPFNVTGVFQQPDYGANLIAAAAPAALVSASDMSKSYQLGGGANLTDAAGNIIYVNQATGQRGTMGAPNTVADTYQPQAYTNTVISDPLVTLAAPGEVPLVAGVYPLKYQTLVQNFFTPADFTTNGRISSSTGSRNGSAAVTQFLNQAYATYGAGSTVTFTLAPSTPVDPAGTPPSAYVVLGRSIPGDEEQLTFRAAPAAVVPEASPLALLGLGLLGLAAAGLRARRRPAASAA